jgi:hypothetical protein
MVCSYSRFCKSSVQMPENIRSVQDLSKNKRYIPFKYDIQITKCLVLDQSNKSEREKLSCIALDTFVFASLFSHKPKKLCGHTRKMLHFSRAVERN